MATPLLPPSYQYIWTSLEQKFERLGPAVQFLLLVGGVFFFFGVHNLLQETMMSIEGFKFGIMLGFMEVLG
jgi:solute carrier family 35 (adenosine 3'-phospho 5'-phosphosulfate transporter), member B3